MKYLKIQNDGCLDVRLISLMGGTTKSGDEYKIGRFGTGLKYTLAYLVRNNIDFKIFIGQNQVKIETVRETIQGTDFDILYINGERSSITSTMGIDWVGWMIVREIWCNALDEGGSLKECTDAITGTDNTTTFYLQLTGEIQETVNNWGLYFLHESEPIQDNKNFAIYAPSEIMRIYKNGVLIHQNEKLKTVFSYDIKNATINELREYKGWATYDVVKTLAQLEKKAAEIFLNSCSEKHFESEMDYNVTYFDLNDWSEGWKEAIGQGQIICKKDFEALNAKGQHLDKDEFVFVPKGLFDKLAHQYPNVSAVRRVDKINSFHETFDSELELKIKAVFAILESCNYFVNPELKFIYGIFGDTNKLAQINMDEKTVMISMELKRKSMFDFVTAIIEENEHFISGHADETRGFQQHFINLYTKELLDKNEIKI